MNGRRAGAASSAAGGPPKASAGSRLVPGTRLSLYDNPEYQAFASTYVCVNAIAFGVIQTRFGLPQSEDEVIEVGGRKVHVGMPAKQAERMGVKVGDKPTDEQMYASRPMPNQMIPLGRSGNIRDAARSIFYLCSPMSD